jgi:hypothetical protein
VHKTQTPRLSLCTYMYSYTMLAGVHQQKDRTAPCSCPPCPKDTQSPSFSPTPWLNGPEHTQQNAKMVRAGWWTQWRKTTQGGRTWWAKARSIFEKYVQKQAAAQTSSLDVFFQFGPRGPKFKCGISRLHSFSETGLKNRV